MARRTYAPAGDRTSVQFSVNGRPRGRRISASGERKLALHIVGGAPIDCVDFVRNGCLLRRVSRCGVPQPVDRELLRTKLYLELGWGQRKKRTDWDLQFGI